MEHPLVQFYAQYTIGDDPEFVLWIHETLTRMRGHPAAAAAAAKDKTSPVPGSFPAGGFLQ